MLDVIGYSTVPGDIETAQSVALQIVQRVLSVPWWVPAGLTAAITTALLWISIRQTWMLTGKAAAERRAEEKEKREAMAEVIADENFLNDLEEVRTDTIRQINTLKEEMVSLRHRLALGMITRPTAEAELKEIDKKFQNFCRTVESSVFSDALLFSPSGREGFIMLTQTAVLGNYHHESNYVSTLDTNIEATMNAREKYISKTIDEATANIKTDRTKLLEEFYLRNTKINLISKMKRAVGY